MTYLFAKVVKKLFLTTLVIFGCLFLSFSQSSEIDLACEQLEKARSLYIQKEFKLASEAAQNIDFIFAKNHSWNDWYDSIFLHYRIHRNLSYEKFEGILKDNITNSHSAYPFYRAKFAFLYAYILTKNGKINSSLHWYNRAYKEFVLLDNKKEIQQCLLNLSNGYSRFNDHASAIQYGIANLKSRDREDQKNRGIALRNLSRYHVLARKYEMALDYIDQALTLDSLNKLTEMTILEARCLIGLGKIDKAQQVLNSISEEYFAIPSKALIKADILHSLGQEVESNLLRKKYLPKVKNHRNQRDYYKELQKYAQSNFAIDSLDLAMTNSHEVIQFVCPDFNNENEFALPKSSSLVPEAWLMEALFLKGKIKSEYYKKNLYTVKAKGVLECYDKSIEVLNLLRNLYSALNSKHQMTESVFEIFSTAIDFSLDEYKKTKDAYYLNRAFEYAQTSKAYVLKESISEREAFKSFNVPENITQSYFSLILKCSEGGEDYLTNVDSLSNLKAKIYNDYPELEFIRNPRPLSIAETKSYLKNGQALILHFLDKYKLSSFVVTKQDESCTQTNAGSSLIEAVNTYSRILNGEKMAKDEGDIEENYLSSASIIYDEVLKEPLTKIMRDNNIDHLIFVPDGILNRISFSNIPLNSKESWSAAKDLLISKYAVSYLHYTNELEPDAKSNNRLKNRTCIGIEYNTEQLDKLNAELESQEERERQLRGAKLMTLPYAKKEALEIASKINSDKLINDEVTLGALKEALKQNDLIHIAGHSIIHPNDFTQSFIPLYSNNENLDRLDYSEIQSLNIDPQLVVLSACNTNNGEEIRTEGRLSMTRAFTESGALSVLGSNWNAPDQISSMIINLFYDNLLKG